LSKWHVAYHDALSVHTTHNRLQMALYHESSPCRVEGKVPAGMWVCEEGRKEAG